NDASGGVRAAHEAHVQRARQQQIVGEAKASGETFGGIGPLRSAPDKSETRPVGRSLWSLDHQPNLTGRGSAVALSRVERVAPGELASRSDGPGLRDSNESVLSGCVVLDPGHRGGRRRPG